MNLQRKLIFPRKDCMDFFFARKGIYVIALALSGYPLIPLFMMMWPKRFPLDTAKLLFFGLSHIPYFRYRSKICFKWRRWSDLFFENTMTSSRYTTTLYLINPWNVMSIARWKVAPTLTSPNGILLNVNMSHFIQKVVLSLSGSKTKT